MKYATCHPDRQRRCWGLCDACFQRERYHRRRAMGLPYWAAQMGSAQRWVNAYPSTKRWRKTNRAAYLAQKKRQHEKNKRLYGADPSKRFKARMRWLNAKAAAQGMPTSDFGVSNAARQCDVQDYTICPKNKRGAKATPKNMGGRPSAKDLRLPSRRRNGKKKEKS